jgi:hypothetical protein
MTEGPRLSRPPRVAAEGTAAGRRRGKQRGRFPRGCVAVVGTPRLQQLIRHLFAERLRRVSSFISFFFQRWRCRPAWAGGPPRGRLFFLSPPSPAQRIKENFSEEERQGPMPRSRRGPSSTHTSCTQESGVIT